MGQIFMKKMQYTEAHSAYTKAAAIDSVTYLPDLADVAIKMQAAQLEANAHGNSTYESTFDSRDRAQQQQQQAPSGGAGGGAGAGVGADAGADGAAGGVPSMADLLSGVGPTVGGTVGLGIQGIGALMNNPAMMSMATGTVLIFDRNLYSRSAIERHTFAPLEALPCM